jgi:hypothetical protein
MRLFRRRQRRLWRNTVLTEAGWLLVVAIAGLIAAAPLAMMILRPPMLSGSLSHPSRTCAPGARAERVHDTGVISSAPVAQITPSRAGC